MAEVIFAPWIVRDSVKDDGAVYQHGEGVAMISTSVIDLPLATVHIRREDDLTMSISEELDKAHPTRCQHEGI
jgi:selenophosphate synthase